MNGFLSPAEIGEVWVGNGVKKPPSPSVKCWFSAFLRVFLLVLAPMAFAGHRHWQRRTG